MNLHRREPNLSTIREDPFRREVQGGLGSIRALGSRAVTEVVNQLGTFSRNQRLVTLRADATACKAALNLRDMDENTVFEAKR